MEAPMTQNDCKTNGKTAQTVPAASSKCRRAAPSVLERAPRFRILPVAAAVLLFAPCLCAQTAGSITGTVHDPSGAVIPNATVTVTNSATQAVRKAVTNSAGLYNVPYLTPGPYTIQASASGFQTALHTGIVLQVQQTIENSFTLQAGSVTQTVEVSAAAAQLDTQDTTVGTVIQNQKILTLPLNGRDFLQLMALSPNVTTNFGSPGQATLRQGTTRAGENYSVMGTRSTSNYYTLDGINNTDPNFNLIDMQPSVDALQEFKVQTGIYPAAFGVEANQINVLTKSGTNNYHGTAFDFLRNDHLDAQQYNFTNGPAPAKNPFKWNQFGFTLGGPVLVPKVFNGRNKLFFMSNYEGFRVRQSSNSLYSVPTKAMRSGDFSSLLPGNQLYNPATKSCSNGVCTEQQYTNNQITNIDAVSQILMEPQYLPLPNLSPIDVFRHNNYLQVNQNPINKDQLTERVDFTQSAKSSWFGRYNWTSENTNSQGLGLAGGKVVTDGDQAVLGWTYIISPNMVNEVHIGWTAFHNNAETALAGVTDVVDSLNVNGFTTPIPSEWGIPQMSVSAPYSGWGDTTSAPFVLKDENFEEEDNFTWLAGRHSLSFGFDIQRGHYDYYGNEFSRGRFSFDGEMTENLDTLKGGDPFADFLTGYCITCADTTSLALTDFRRTAQFYYGEDTWQLTSKLTLNYGLRYAYVPPWKDISQNIINTIVPDYNQVLAMNQADITTPSLQPTLYRPGSGNFYGGLHENVLFPAPIQTMRENLYGGRLVQANHLNFAPRFGLSYKFLPNWVVRSGFGIYFAQDSAIEYFDMARGWGRIAANNSPQNPTVTYHNFIQTNGGVTILNNPNAYGYIPNTATPYLEDYMLDIQHTIGSNTELDLNYSGSVGRHLEGIMNLNPAVPGTTGTPNSRSPFPYLGIIQVLEGEDVSTYNAFSAKLSRSTAAGLTYLASYTLSKSLDDSSAIRGTSNDILPQNDRCLICDYGYSAFNIPNRFVGSVIYQLPLGAGKMFLHSRGLSNQVVGGWEVSSILTWQSGLPINTAAGIATAGTAGYGETRLDATSVSPNQSSRKLAQWFNPAAFAEPARGTFGNYMRNGVKGPQFIEWDFSTLKNFPITESKQLQFRLELFNAPNHPNWAPPSLSWGSSGANPGPGFDTISSTQNAPNSMREIQAALKFIF
jgi:Carboxypeptidase regulatory-like domain